ncbi:uncharacterized protein YbjT (DUF2867 family) [Arthrobacter agilis]|nr:uncharacterized protein YbjT (DUF2867 family) [Arthrobacter agilis]
MRAVERCLVAAESADVRRFVLVSVSPEAWRERHLSDDEDYYFAAKKTVEVHVTRSALDWLILRPSLLTDGPGEGRVFLGPAAEHHQISRHDVADVLAELLRHPTLSRRILELDRGSTPIIEAVGACVPA